MSGLVRGVAMAKYVFKAKVLALVAFTLIGKHPWISLILLNACQNFAQSLVTDTPDSVFCLPGDSQNLQH